MMFAGSLERREFLASTLAFCGGAAATLTGLPAARAASRPSLDPVDPDIWFGTTGSYFGTWVDGNMKMSNNMPMMLADCKHYGLQGFEPYSPQVVQFLGNPQELKKMSEQAGVTIVDVGDLPHRPGVAPPRPAGHPRSNPWLGKEGNAELIEEMVSFARDFLSPLGCDHWKNNMGARPEGGPSEEQLKYLAHTANEIGRQTLTYGVRLALHPHIWGPMEREHEFRTVMQLTDPRYVFLTFDTGHNVLGGMNPVRMISDYFPRIAEIHLKDTYAKFRGNNSTPTQAEHRVKSLYTNLGGGGVDFPAVFKLLRDRHFKGWAVLDIDAPRPGDGTGSVDDNIKVSINYLRDMLHVKLPKPAGKGLFTEG